MPKALTTQHIIEGCLEGKASFQKELVIKFSGMLYTVCLRYMKSEMEAQDILQDSFIKIFKNIASYDSSRGSFEGWIRKITVNTALKELGKRKLNVTSMSFEIIEHKSEDPWIINKLNADELLSFVRALPDAYRQVFNLSVIEGYSHREIGKMVGIEEGTSRSNLSRAKQILRKKISETKNLSSWAKIS